MAVVLMQWHLNKHSGAITAAANINAAIEQDSVVGLIGTNGAGKTHVHQHDHRLYQAQYRQHRLPRDANSPRSPPGDHPHRHLPFVSDPASLRFAERVRTHDGGAGS